MARRRRVSPIGMFGQSLMQGLQLGFQHADRREAIAARREAINAQMEKNRQQAEYNRQKLGIEGMKANAYSTLANANARKADRWTPGGGKGAAAPGMSQGLQGFLKDNPGMPVSDAPDAPPTYTFVAPTPDAPMDQPPVSSTDDSGLGDAPAQGAARGGKIQKMARGGRARGAGDQFNAGLMNSMRMMDYMDRAQERRNAALKDVGTKPTIKKIGSTMEGDTQAQPPPATATMPPGTGTTGPGSGYGEVAPPPSAYGGYGAGLAGMNYAAAPEMTDYGDWGRSSASAIDTGATGAAGGAMTGTSDWAAGGAEAGTYYRSGGSVQRMAGGGKPFGLMGMVGSALGSRWLADRMGGVQPRPRTDGSVPPATSSTPGPGQPLPKRFTDDDRGAAYDWAERGQPRSIKRGDRGHALTVPMSRYDAGDYENMPPRQEPRPDDYATQQGPTGTDVVVDSRSVRTSPPAAAPRRGGNGGGYQARGGMLGDQRRTTAYDPTADRMDPRNIGVVNERYETNPMVYAATQHGGIELTDPRQKIFQRGGRVHFQDGGRYREGMPMADPAYDPPGSGGERITKDTKLINSQNPTPFKFFTDTNVGKQGVLSYGAGADPWSKRVGGEVGYEHKFDNGARVGGQVYRGQPTQAGDQGETRVGVRFHMPFSTGGRGYAEGGPVRQFQQGGSGRLPVPFQRGQTPMPGIRGGISGGTPPGMLPDQGGGEAVGGGQDEADRLTEIWRQEAHEAARINQQGGPMQTFQLPPRQPQGPGQLHNEAAGQPNQGYATRPTAQDEGRGGPNQSYVPQPEPGDQAGGSPAAQTYPPVPVPPLPERDPAWARDPAYPDPNEGAGSPRQSWRPDRMDGPDRTEQRAPVYPDPNEGAGSPRQGYGPPTRPTSHDEGAGSPRQSWRPDRMEGPDSIPRGPQQSGFVGEEERADERSRNRQQGYGPGSGAPPRGAPPRGAPPANGSARGGPSAPGSSAGQDEADRLTREYNSRSQGSMPPPSGGAISAQPPMAQGTYEPEGGTGLAGPGAGISTNNAARDYLGAANTFANWALKDAGPQNKDQATASLYSGKGAATTDEVGTMFMAVDPDGKMPLDKRMEASAKALHDFYIAKNDPKMAAQAVFQIAQYGVAQSRQNGAAALKMAQAGNEQGALKELMAGYSWLVDKGTARIDGQNIVVMGDDGKMRAQIPLQPGTVQNLAMGMMSGQLGWDALRRGGDAGGAPAAPAQAVNASYPAAGNQQPTAPPSASATGAQPSAASAGPAPAPAAPAPSRAVNTTPPQAQPATAAPTAAPAPASRPPAPRPTQTQPAAGGQVPPGKGQYETSTIEKTPRKMTPDVNVPFVPAGSEAASGAAGEPKPPAKPTTTAEDMEKLSPAEKEARAHYDKHPLDPPPKLLHQHAPPPAEVHAMNEELRRLEKSYMDRRHKIEADVEKYKLSPSEQKQWVQPKLRELAAEYKEQRQELVTVRNKYLDKSINAQTHEANVVLKPRDISLTDEEKIKERTNDRAKAVDADVVNRQGKGDPDKQKMRDRTVLRYMVDENERRPLYEIANGIWRHNKGLTAEAAVDRAIALTSIIPESEGRSRMNYQKGQYAVDWRAVGGNLDQGIRVQMGDGTLLNLDPDTHNRVKDLQQHNWRQSKDTEGQKKIDAAKLAKQKEGLAGRAIKLLPPPFGAAVAGAVGAAGGR